MLDFYFLAAPPSGWDPGGAIADEAKVLDHIPIANTSDFINRVANEVKSTGGKIRRMVISGHGSPYHFTIGEDSIHKDSPYLFMLSSIGPFFASDAEVRISACEIGQNRDLLRRLSQLWGGVKVVAHTGSIVVWEWAYWGEVRPTGDRVVCMLNKCKVDAQLNMTPSIGGVM
jgi:hypothetical protein